MSSKISIEELLENITLDPQIKKKIQREANFESHLPSWAREQLVTRDEWLEMKRENDKDKRIRKELQEKREELKNRYKQDLKALEEEYKSKLPVRSGRMAKLLRAYTMTWDDLPVATQEEINKVSINLTKEERSKLIKSVVDAERSSVFNSSSGPS